jgi:hypothetical protein
MSSAAILVVAGLFGMESAGWPHRWFPVGDALLYDTTARRMSEVGREVLSQFALSRSYVILVTVYMTVARAIHVRLVTVAFVSQSLLWSASAGLLIYTTSRRNLEEGALVAFLLIGCGQMYFFSAVLLPVSATASLTALCLVLLGSDPVRSKLWSYSVLGLLSAILIDLRPHALLAVLMTQAWIVIYGSGPAPPRWRRVGVWIGVAVGSLATLSVLARDASSGRPALRASAGFNLYIGNHPGASGHYEKIVGLNNEPFGFAQAIREVASSASATALSATEADRWWARRAFGFAVDRPLAEARVIGKKASELASGTPYPINYDYRAFRSQSRILRACLVDLSLLVPLACGSLLLLGRQRPAAAWFLGYAASILLFFVALEHTLPLIVPAASLVAAATVTARRTPLRSLRAQLAVAAVVLAATVGYLSRENWPPAATYRQMRDLYRMAGDTVLAGIAEQTAERLESKR